MFATKSLFPHISDKPSIVRTDLEVKPPEKANRHPALSIRNRKHGSSSVCRDKVLTDAPEAPPSPAGTFCFSWLSARLTGHSAPPSSSSTWLNKQTKQLKAGLNASHTLPPQPLPIAEQRTKRNFSMELSQRGWGKEATRSRAEPDWCHRAGTAAHPRGQRGAAGRRRM